MPYFKAYNKDELNEYFREYVSKSRIENHVSQTILSKETGLTQKTISKLENGSKRFSLWEAYVLCRYFYESSHGTNNALESLTCYDCPYKKAVSISSSPNITPQKSGLLSLVTNGPKSPHEWLELLTWVVQNIPAE